MSGSCSSGSCSRPTPGSRAVSGSNSRRPVTCPRLVRSAAPVEESARGRLKNESDRRRDRALERRHDAADRPHRRGGLRSRANTARVTDAQFTSRLSQRQPEARRALNVHLDYSRTTWETASTDQERRTLTRCSEAQLLGETLDPRPGVTLVVEFERTAFASPSPLTTSVGRTSLASTQNHRPSRRRPLTYRTFGPRRPSPNSTQVLT